MQAAFTLNLLPFLWYNRATNDRQYLLTAYFRQLYTLCRNHLSTLACLVSRWGAHAYSSKGSAACTLYSAEAGGRGLRHRGHSQALALTTLLLGECFRGGRYNGGGLGSAWAPSCQRGSGSILSFREERGVDEVRGEGSGNRKGRASLPLRDPPSSARRSRRFPTVGPSSRR